MKRKIPIWAIVLATLVTILILMRLATPDLTWGHGRLKVSEQWYYSTRVKAVVDQWKAQARQSVYDETGRIIDPAFTCLFVDTAQRIIGLEKAGILLPDFCVELPSQMDWTAYHSSPNGTVELPSISRFHMRGLYEGRYQPEAVFLVGTLDTEQYFYFELSPNWPPQGIKGNGTWSPKIRSWRTPKTDAYRSIVVDADEYAQRRTEFDSVQSSLFEIDKAKRLEENRIAWTCVEKQIYQDIETYVNHKGYTLSNIQITPGPDYTAAMGYVNTRKTSWPELFRNNSDLMFGQIRIDRLVNDIWYVRIGPPSPPISSKILSLDFELLVSATERIPRHDRQRLLAEGRAKQAPESQPPSKWQVTTPSGAGVEFVAICESPSGGKAWWNPDGSPLDYVPYINYDVHPHQSQYALGILRPAIAERLAGRKVYEIIWQTHPGSESRWGRPRIEDYDIGMLAHTIDRYGNRQYSSGAEYFAVDKSRTSTNVRFSAKAEDGFTEWVMFKNISLVPGQDMGFEIIQGDEAKPEHP